MSDPGGARQRHEAAGAATAGPGGVASQLPGPPPGGEESFTYHHVRYEAGQHWFSAEHDGDEVGHAYVIERQEPGGPHVEIKRLWTNPHYRRRGIGSRLLDNVGVHFKGRELRLKPYPIDEDGGQDEGDLREFYGNRGFGAYQLRAGDPFELYDYMTTRAPRDAHRAAPAELPTACGLWYRVHPADSLALDQGKARSRSIETPRIGQAGLSAFASPHHLYSYILAMGWGGRTWLHGYDDGITPRRVLAFHGREIGRGEDDEPLVRPEAGPGCCGRIVHSRMAWSTFVRKLSGTAAPGTGWTPGQALEKGRRRTTGTRGQSGPAAERAAARQTGADFPGPARPRAASMARAAPQARRRSLR